MTGRDNLTPTPTVDKNGKRTTVYRRLVKMFGASELPAPPVANPVSPERKETIQGLVNAYVPYGGNMEDRIRRELNSYPDDLLKELLEIHRGAVAPSAAHGIQARVSECEGEAAAREAILFYPLIADRYVYWSIKEVVDSLRSYPHLCDYDDLTVAGPEVQAECVALMKVHGAVKRVLGDEGFAVEGHIADPDLVLFVRQEHERADRIAEIIVDRETIDVDLIRQVLDADAPALSDGFL